MKVVMNINKKIIYVSVAIIVLSAVLFATVRFINNKSRPKNVISEKKVSVYFSTERAMYLAPEKRLVKKDNLFQNTINKLIEGPKDNVLNKTIPDGVKLLGIEVEDGRARINFNRALVDNHWGGSTGERMTVYSIVNTLTQFSEIRRVLILIEGKRVETLVGHMDLSEPLSFNKKIIK
jgi:spore germination protein GerM